MKTLISLLTLAVPFTLTTVAHAVPATMMNVAPAVTAMNINDQASEYIGKKVSITGNVDRVLSPGAYILTDRGDVSGPAHKILVLTPGASLSPSSSQSAGTVGTVLQEGDLVKIQGKVERLAMSAETDTFAPKSDQETIRESGYAMPVVIAQPGSIQKQY